MKKFIVCHDIEGKKYRTAVEDLNFRPAVFAVIFQNNKILLSRIFDGYDFPGGGIKKGEHIKDALKREVHEETGIKIQPDKVISVNEDFFISIESRRKLHSILIYYSCKKPEGKVNIDHLDKDEKKIMSKAEWIDLKDIEKIKFCNGINSVKLIKRAIEEYL